MFKFIKKVLIVPMILFVCLISFNIKILKAETNTNVSTTNLAEVARIKDKSEEWGNPYLAVSLLYPVVEVPSNSIAQRNINNSIQEYIDKVKSAAEDIQKMSDRNKTSMTSPYYCTTEYMVTYNKDNLLSIIIAYADYKGGARGVLLYEPFNFDLSTGKRLMINDLFKDDKSIQSLNLINKTVSDGFENSAKAIFKFDGINENVKFLLDGTCLRVLFNPYEYTSYDEGNPIFKMPYSMFGDSLKYETLKNTNYRYNDIDVVYFLESSVDNSNNFPYIPQQYGFNMNKEKPEISMLYTAAKYMYDNDYNYYITPDELETFVYHVYGRKINAYDIIKDSSDKTYEFDSLQCKNGMYYFSSKRPTEFLDSTITKTINNNNATTDAYGLIYEYSKDDTIKETYGFKLAYMKSSNSCLGYNILNYNIELLDYSDMISEKIDNMLKE